MKYPKIETLYRRDDKFKVDPSQLRLPEFRLVNEWMITEKVDGTNIRIFLVSTGEVRFGGRTDRSQMPTFLLSVLQDMFTPEKMATVFPAEDDLFPSVILYGEGYGPKIQKGGGNYRDSPSFCLFDVRVGDWWLNWPDVEDVAMRLDIQTVPCLGYSNLPRSRDDLSFLIPHSLVAHMEAERTDVQAEGIVARTDPLLCRRNGQRLMWKLKFKDFPS